MTEPRTPYFVTYKEPIEGIVVKQNCKHCGHDTEVGVETEDGRFIPLKVGEKVRITGIDISAQNFGEGHFIMKTPSISYQGSA